MKNMKLSKKSFKKETLYTNFRKKVILLSCFTADVNSVFSLTVTLNWDTEMLFGWTLRRTHCLMSDAKRRGSDERSHFSFLVHLEEKKKKQERGFYSQMTNAHMDLVTWPGFTPFHLLAPGKKRMSRRSLTERVRHIYHISPLAVHYLQWPVNGNPDSRGWEQTHLKQWLLYVWQ